MHSDLGSAPDSFRVIRVFRGQPSEFWFRAFRGEFPRVQAAERGVSANARNIRRSMRAFLIAWPSRSLLK
jgi:hypothetical protein